MNNNSIPKSDSFDKALKAINAIVDYSNDSYMIKHFLKECELAWGTEDERDEMQNLMIKQIVEILSVLYIQGDTNNTIKHKLNLLTNAIQFNIISPLKFTDNEWNTINNDDEYQNTRISSVFKKGDLIYDINAYAKHEIGIFEINFKKYTKREGGCWQGRGIYLIDDNLNVRYVSIAKIINKESFRGNNKLCIPSICLYDSADTKNDYICYVSLEKFITNKWKKDYEFLNHSNRDNKKELNIVEQNKNQIYQILRNYE